MGPGQFVTQCVTNRVGQKKQPHVAEVRRVVAFAKLRRETLRKTLQDSLPVVSSLLPSLLILDNLAPDLPIGIDHHHIDRLPSTVSRRNEDFPNPIVKSIEPALGCPHSWRGGARLGSLGAGRIISCVSSPCQRYITALPGAARPVVTQVLARITRYRRFSQTRGLLPQLFCDVICHPGGGRLGRSSRWHPGPEELTARFVGARQHRLIIELMFARVQSCRF